jgi:hypothetical protein
MSAAAPADPAGPGPAGRGPAEQLDRNNPWPGLASYDESARLYFNGRSAEITELTRRVLDEPLTVLFGRSGLGKSSLLKAGLFPALREHALLPVYIRLQLLPQAPPLSAQVRTLLEHELRAASIDYPDWPEDATLWQYLHQCGLEFWNTTNRLVTPVLVFDQFEEVFTLGRQLPSEIERFRTELADLIENRVPASMYSRLDTEGARALCLDLKAMPYKVVLSLREDFLADLENWRASIPSLRRNRMRLLPMRAANALQAIHNDRTAHLVDDAQARQVVAFLAARTAEADPARVAADAGPATEAGDDSDIDPALLSLFCAGVNLRRQRAGKARFDDELIGAAKRTVVADFYRDCVTDLPPAARAFIENELVTEQGYRNSFAASDAIGRGYLSEAQLAALVDRRLLRRTHVLGTDRIELTHDLLTGAVVRERDIRLKAEREAQQRREQRRARLWVAGAVAAILVSAGISYRFERLAAEAERQHQQALSRQLAAMATKEIGRNHELATWLAAKSLSFGDTAQSREALFDTARYAWPHEKIAGVARLGGRPTAIAMSNSGKFLAVLAEPGDADAGSGQAVVSLWDIERAKPEVRWSRRIALRDAERLVLSRDRETRFVAVGGSRTIELLDAETGACVLRIATPSRVGMMAFGASKGPFFGWAGDRVHVLASNPAAPGATAAQTGCADGPAPADGVAVPMKTLDVDETKEMSFGRTGALLLLRLRPTGHYELRHYSPDAAGEWRQEVRELLMDCPSDASMSLGTNRYSTTLSPATCAFSVGRDAGGDVAPDDKFDLAESRERRWVRNVVWAGFGAAHLKVLGDGELEVSGPDFAKRWRVHLKGVDFPAHGRYDDSLKNELALSGNGRRVAAVGHREAAVTVYSLEPRPFLSELAAGTFAVAPDAAWVAVETERRWRENDSTLTVFVRQEAAYRPAWTIKLPIPPQQLAASADALVIRFPRPEPGARSAPSESIGSLRGTAQALQVERHVLDAALETGKAQTLPRPATAEQVAAGPRSVVVEAADPGNDKAPSSAAAAGIAGSAPAGSAPAPSTASSDPGASGKADACRIPLTRSQRVSGPSPEWFAIWDEGSVELFDSTCRDYGRYEIAGVSGVGTEGGGSVLRIDLDRNRRSMLVPLDRKVTEKLGDALLTPDFNPDLCRIARIDCTRERL